MKSIFEFELSKATVNNLFTALAFISAIVITVTILWAGLYSLLILVS